jgi:hypothetical protein
MVKKPGLFNEAMEGFFRSTEAVARQREHAHTAAHVRRSHAHGLEPVIEEGDAP